MRKRLSNTNEVYHYWANKVQPEGYCGNVSFDGDKAYSYRACIGRHIAPGVVAVSDYKYSVTTSSHQSDCRSAARHLRVIHVAHPDSLNDSKRVAKRRIEEWLKKASTAKGRKDYYLSEAKSEADNFNAFAEVIGYPSEKLDDPVAGADLVAIAKAQREEQKRQLELRKERERIAKQSLAEILQAWRDGGHTDWRLRQLPVALRINGDNVTTTYGASIPVADALKLWPLIQRAKRCQREYEVGQPVGVYRLTKIRSNGSIVVGCHDIPYSELESIANQLQLAEVTE